MIYLVTLQQELFDNDVYKVITVEESLGLLRNLSIIQCDSETTGKDARLSKLLLFQIGNDSKDIRVVIDTTTVDIRRYKDILENTWSIYTNAKFDLQFLYNYNIIPKKVIDIMIIEQILYLGYTHISVSPEEYSTYNYDFPYLETYEEKTGELKYTLSFSLKALVKKYLGINMDKTVRGEIIWRGIDTAVVKYAAYDVTLMEAIFKLQLEELRKKECLEAAKIECAFIPSLAYMEWCGIHLDSEKWSNKIKQDIINLNQSLDALNSYCIKHPKLQKWVYINRQGDLFEGYDLTPKFKIDWQKEEAKHVFKALGFNLKTISKTTKSETESVMEKILAPQKGIDDTFLKLYLDYQGYYKVISSFGQGHLNAINPKTDRIHSIYRQLGATSGRMSCGSSQSNDDLAKYKHLKPKDCTYPNIQQLPADDATRGSFTAPRGYLWSSCDFSSLESRLGADIYQEKSMLDEFLYGSGDMHSLCAYMIYKEIPRDTPIKDIKKLYPKYRKEVKPIELDCEDSL